MVTVDGTDIHTREFVRKETIVDVRGKNRIAHTRLYEGVWKDACLYKHFSIYIYVWKTFLICVHSYHTPHLRNLFVFQRETRDRSAIPNVCAAARCSSSRLGGTCNQLRDVLKRVNSVRHNERVCEYCTKYCSRRVRLASYFFYIYRF